LHLDLFERPAEFFRILLEVGARGVSRGAGYDRGGT